MVVHIYALVVNDDGTDRCVIRQRAFLHLFLLHSILNLVLAFPAYLDGNLGSTIDSLKFIGLEDQIPRVISGTY